MNTAFPDPSPSHKPCLSSSVLKGLILYAFFPAACLILLAGPIGGAVRASAPAAFLILLAALACVGFNWFVYTLVRRKRPSLLVFAHGTLCLLAAAVIEYEALPASDQLASTLAVIAGCLALLCLFLLSFWFAARRSRPAHVIAVGLWICIGVLALILFYRVFDDFRTRHVSLDTWITIVILTALVPGAFARRIRRAARLRKAQSRATGLAAGRIAQLVGETRLDLDDDPVTDYHARVLYTVGDTEYETRAAIRKLTMRRFGKKAFIGLEIPVRYVPEHPAEGYANRIDRHIFDQLRAEQP